VVALELCSLTFQPGDRTKRNLVAASLFGDGAAAAIVSTRGTEAGTGSGRSRLVIEAAGGTLWPDTLDVMGWDVDREGLHVIFSRDIPAIVRERAKPSIESFLAGQGLDLGRVSHLAAHPGGLKVLDAYRDALGLEERSVRHARSVLREFGNMSAPTCLFVLERFIEGGEVADGEHVLVTALGPGFGAEYVLLRSTAS
jgi:alkylresorcinol/alkylpyrone synthase